MLGTLWTWGHALLGYGIAALIAAGGVWAWFQIPVAGKYLGAAALVLAGILTGHEAGYQRALVGAEARELKATIAAKEARIAELDRQAKASAEIAERATVREINNVANASKLQEQINAYEAEIASRDACLLSDDDVRRMRDFSGPGSVAPEPPRRPADVR